MKVPLKYGSRMMMLEGGEFLKGRVELRFIFHFPV
jgi:hypothetical protein